MSRLTHISFGRYKSFYELQTVEFRPITVLFGHNSSGKSAALRLLPALADSARPHQIASDIPSVFDYTSPALRGATFTDLLNAEHSGSSIQLSMDWLDIEYSMQIRLGNSRDGEFVSVFSAITNQQEIVGTLGGSVGTHTYDLLDAAGNTIGATTGMKGLVPEPGPGTPQAQAEQLARVADRLHLFSSSVHWLGAIRQQPPRFYKFGPGTSRGIGHDGSGTPQTLRKCALNANGVDARVSDWLVRTCGCELLTAETELQSTLGQGLFPFLMRVAETGALVSLQDVGEGVAQALPVITLCHQARSGMLGEHPILAVEQPELHLHPRAAVILADEICACVAEGSPATHLIETHSESILLSLQTAIVEGRLKPADIAVYWIEQNSGRSTIDLVSFDDEGFPNENWPGGVFRETLLQAQHLADLRTHQS